MQHEVLPEHYQAPCGVESLACIGNLSKHSAVQVIEGAQNQEHGIVYCRLCKRQNRTNTFAVEGYRYRASWDSNLNSHEPPALVHAVSRKILAGCACLLILMYAESLRAALPFWPSHCARQ